MPLKKTITKSAQSEKHVRSNSASTKISKGSTGTGATMKMTVTSAPTMTARLHHRKVLRLAGKRPSAHHHHAHRAALGQGPGKGRQQVSVARTPPIDSNACDNSDDSGLGFDHHMDIRPIHYTERNLWVDDMPDIKRRKLELKVENEETNDGYCFPESLKNCKENNTIIRTLPCLPIQNIGRNVSQNGNASKNISRCLPLVTRRAPVTGPITLTTQLGSTSRNGKIHLQIMCQPEQQHRARYQTEGSRGAVKDRTGNSFPIVKLIGYDKPTTLQIFIGTDLGRVAPHMFYQACRVSGKNSTPCMEKKIDGTIVIEVELEPSKDMIATCDCVGILKERNVDVEHRFPEQLSPRSKKKSTKCRMVFRTSIANDDGTTETLQVCSQPIVCTQPPGIPEICKKSLTSCPANGGLELFILGKNFLKDTRVVFQQQRAFESSAERTEIIWEDTVTPDKEYLQQTHLVCVVPAYIRQDIQDAVQVRLFVVSSGKNSEAHSFMFLPVPGGPQSAAGAAVPAVTVTGATVRMEANPPSTAPFLSKMLWQTGTPKQEMDLGMMPPPTSLVPLAQRRPSANMTMVECNSPPMRSLKTELIDENSQSSVAMDHMINENSLDMRHRFRALSESSLDVHHDDNTNMTIISENSIDMLNQQREIIKTQIDVMNENSNSVHSFQCEKSNASVHNDECVDASRPPESRIFAQNELLTAHSLMPPAIQAPTLSTNDLKGIDLRMKTSLVTTLNDLANTQSPSLATLHRFVVTEPTNMPLPAQTGQSVENFLTTLENNNNKSIVSVTLANSTIKSETEHLMLQSLKTSTLLDGTPILSSQFSVTPSPSTINALNQLMPADTAVSGTNKLFSNAQVINNTQVLTNTTRDILPNLNESHMKNPNSFEQHINNTNLITTGPVLFGSQPTSSTLMESNHNQAEVLKQTDANLLISQQNLQAALNANLLQSTAATSKLDALVNSAVDTHIGSPIKSPQQELSPLLPNSPQEMLRQSPILVPQNPDILITSSPDVILNSQSPLLAPNDIMIHSPQNEMVNSAHVSPEVILNPQVPTNVMCRTAQDTLLQVSNICQQSVMQNSAIQSEILATETSNALLTLKSPPVSVESIVINAAVDDYLQTQKKLSEFTRMDNHLLQTSVDQQKSAQEQNLINSLLDVRNNGSPTHQAVTDLSLSTAQFLTQVNLNLHVSKQPESNKSDLVLVKQINEQSVNPVQQQQQQQSTELKKNEEGMIPQALTNMSENDLISYINPSCFDQGTFTT